MTVYKGSRERAHAQGPVSVVVYREGRPAYTLRHMIVHSPTGMGYGYHGSGAADLALSILADALDEAAAIPAYEGYSTAIARRIQDTGAWLLHQDFKRDVVAALPPDRGFTLNGAAIEAWLAPRRPEMERLLRERRLLALLGKRVTLTDGTIVDVLDIVDNAAAETLLVYAVGNSAVHRAVALAEVARVMGPIPDDEDEEVMT